MIQSESIVSAYAPPLKIVAKYFFAAMISFVILNFLLLLNSSSIYGHHFQPKILSINHIATLGWITMIVFGAMFQLVPVVLETKLFSERLAEIQFWIYLPGVIGLAYSFWVFDTGINMTVSAIVLNLAMFIFSFNILFTIKSVKNLNVTGWYLTASIFYLIVTAIAGLLLAINLWVPYIKSNHLRYLNLHAHIAFIGWISMVIMGVSFKLIPMFTLSHGYSLTNAKRAFWIINIGLLGLSTTILFENTTFLYHVFTGLIVLGIILFLLQIHIIFKKRIRKKFDFGIKFSTVAYIMLGLTTVLGTFIAVVNYESIINLTLVYGYMIIFGYMSMLIVGQMYKIVPFLAWYHKYSSKVGLAPVPMLKDMFNEKFAHVQFYFMLTAVFVTLYSLAFKSEIGLLISFASMFISSIIFLFNMIAIFRK